MLLQPIEDDLVYSKLICIDGTGGVLSGLKLPDLNDPQKLGSAITYYRRYTLASLLGLQAVDDDANLSSGKVDSEVEKKWLNTNTPEYTKAIEYLQGGGSLDAIKTKYKVSKKIADELAKL